VIAQLRDKPVVSKVERISGWAKPGREPRLPFCAQSWSLSIRKRAEIADGPTQNQGLSRAFPARGEFFTFRFKAL